MKSAAKFSLVLVTAPDLKTARALAKTALQAKLIACANLIPRVESHYWWQGKLESGAEVLLILKTPRTRLSALEKLILARHPYDTPEFLALPLSAGSRKYLDWLATSCPL
jgi:periplasmic divalent cation tolerance protein